MKDHRDLPEWLQIELDEANAEIRHHRLVAAAIWFGIAATAISIAVLALAIAGQWR